MDACERAGGQARTTLNSDNISNCIAQGGYLCRHGHEEHRVLAEHWRGGHCVCSGAQRGAGLGTRCAVYTLWGLDNAIYGVGVNEDGARHVIRINGYNVNVVSTPAISRLLSTVQSFTNATAMGYALDGHPFFGLERA